MEEPQAVIDFVDQLPDEGESGADGLTDRELQVLRLVTRGKRNREIAAELAIATNTVDRHVNRILKKTGAANRAEAAAYAVRRGLAA